MKPTCRKSLSGTGQRGGAQLKQERQIARLALQNIVTNIARLVKEPETRVTHVSAVAEAAADFSPTPSFSAAPCGFRLLSPENPFDFTDFIQATRTPVLGICGGHQLIGLSFGARVVTLDKQEQESAAPIALLNISIALCASSSRKI